MHDFFRSKGFLIILIIVAVLSIFIAATYRDRAKVSFIEDTVNSVVKPVQSFSVKASNSIIHFFERVFSSTDLDKENEQLRVKLAQYEIIESELETLREENSRLKDLLNYTDITDMLKAPEKEKVKSGARLLVRKLAEASAIRAPQADTIAKEIASSRHPSIIVCGDFNDTPISYTHRVIAQNLNDAFTQSGRGLGVSYNQNKFYFRIDNILISKNLQSYNCTVDQSIKESDHYPIWCYIAKRQ